MSNMQSPFIADDTNVYTQTVPLMSSPLQSYPPDAAGDFMSQPVNSMGDGISMGDGMIKKKRGRPRRNPPNGSFSQPSAGLTSPTGQSQSGELGAVDAAPVSSGKKPRGRPPGSVNKNTLASASGAAGGGFTPHIISVPSGEDVLAKLVSFYQNNARTLCILSANGSISNVTLRQPATSGGTVAYEGRFEILSLSGSFILTETDGQRSRTGGLSVSLAGPDGRVIGGSVAGLLIAASPVQVIVGSFVAASPKHSRLGDAEVQTAMTNFAGGSLSESSGGPGSPFNQSNNSIPQGLAGLPWRC